VTLPGHSITIGERPPATIADSDTAAWFVAGFTERGSYTQPILVRSLAQAVEKAGDRLTYGPLYDALDTYFREGGSIAYIGRVVGPNPVLATHTFNDSTPAAAIRVDAVSVGSWGNNITVAISTGSVGGTFVITVAYNDTNVEVSPDLADGAAAQAWAAANSKYIVVTDLPGGVPANIAATALTGGTDDHTNATDATWLAALNLFTDDYGPGQVSAPGRTTTQGYTDLLNHATKHNRRAVLDGADTSTVSTLTTAASGLRSLTAPDQAGNSTSASRYGALYAPWAVVPGISPGTTRTVPYSAVQAGLIARAESEGHNPNEAAAGPLGRARYATGLSQPAWTDSQRETLNEGGVNVSRLIGGVPTTYGDRTLVNPLTDALWKSFANSREVMAAAADCSSVMAEFDFAQLDGRGFKIAELGGELRGTALLPHYLRGALYGNSPDEAFTVNVGPDVNTPDTISAGELHADVALRVSPNAEKVQTRVVRVSAAESL
jgi:phage tail sheath protein FI